MYAILVNLFIWLFLQSSFAADHESRALSARVLANKQFALICSIYNKDMPLMYSLLEAGAEAQQGLLLRCRTVAQAKLLIAHGLSIKKENNDYGFLPERMAFDADPELLIYFLEQIPLSIANRYGRDVYFHLLAGLVEVSLDTITKEELCFDQKLQILIDHNCYYDHRMIMEAISGYNDTALGNDREGVRKRFETIAIVNEPKERENVLPLLQQRSRTGFTSSNIKRLALTNLQHLYGKEIRQYEKQKRIEAIEKGLSGSDL